MKGERGVEMESVREKMQAILALMNDAKRAGRNGEAEAAKHMLDKLAKKYKVSIDGLVSPDRKWVEFRYKTQEETFLLISICSKIRNTIDIEARIPSKGKRKALFFELSAAEAIDFEIMYKYYHKIMAAEIRDFLIAFMQKNEIRPNFTKTIPSDELTDEKLDELRRRELLRQSIRRHANPLSAGYLNAGKKNK